MSLRAAAARQLARLRPTHGWLTGLLVLMAAVLLEAQEVQRHGLVFETWVRETFFPGGEPAGYTDRWDIPAARNRDHGGIPVNPKAVKWGTPIDLGDALRQWEIEEPFWLVAGFWEQATPGEKRFVKIVAARVEPAQWRALWGDITRADLERLDAIVKDRALTPAEARRAAQALKRTAPFTTGTFVLNPKIDARGQRRLQCSLRFADFLTHLAPEVSREPDPVPALWGVPFPGPIAGGPREFAGEDGAGEDGR